MDENKMHLINKIFNNETKQVLLEITNTQNLTKISREALARKLVEAE